jgi:uncharacterized protein
MAPEKDVVIEFLKENKKHLEEAYGIKRIGLFGSVARGENALANDLDIIVDMPNPTFDHYMDLKFELEDKFVFEVDLVLEDNLKDAVKGQVLKEVIYA